MRLYVTHEMFLKYLYINKCIAVLSNGHKVSVKHDEWAVEICCATSISIVNNNALSTENFGGRVDLMLCF